MLNIIDRKIFTQEGKYLKTIQCPKKISASDLEQKDEQTLYCNNCEKDIIDTQYIKCLMENIKVNSTVSHKEVVELFCQNEVYN